VAADIDDGDRLLEDAFLLARVIWSEVPPAANGTTTVIGFSGHAASAVPPSASPAIAPAASNVLLTILPPLRLPFPQATRAALDWTGTLSGISPHRPA
jgi:hypothetical protein